MKKKILIVIDSEGWALDNIAKEIKKNLSVYYDIDIISTKWFKDNIIKVLILSKKYDLTHFLWRGCIYWVCEENSKEYIKNIGMTYNEFIEEYLEKNNITTSVYDHMFLNNEYFEITKFITNITKNYTVSSKKIEEIYNNLDGIMQPNMLIQDGVDLDLFLPKRLERFNNIEEKIVRIGWVGNSKFKDSEEDDDLKGLRKIILPALQELKDDGYNIEENFADRNIKMIPHEEMPNYYNEIDLYICASKTEGTPNPVLESMACGIPIISTDVGIVPEVFGEKQKKFILEERSKECLKKKIIYLLENKKLFVELSKENLEQIKKWSWTETSLKFKEFFDENLKDGENEYA